MEKHLTRCTSLDELAESWGAATFTGSSADKWVAFWAEVEGCLAEGGELWEWESDGLRSFAGVYGVAVVRGGRWVREWQIGRS